MKKRTKKFALDYLSTFSPTGHEVAGQKVWLDYLGDSIDEYFTDTYGTAVGVINPNQDYKVVIEAHADEISWFVNYITESGYIHVTRNGGSDFAIAPSMRVKIFGEKGAVPAVFGWPAIHVRPRAGKDEPTPNQKSVFLDCGCSSKKEVEKLGIHVGAVAVFTDEPMFMNKKYLVGRALDNRIGGIVIAEVAKKLKENNIKLPFTLYVVNSVQEEIGLRGAEMISRRLKADVAICTDVCHDTQSPHYNKIAEGDTAVGKGPVLTYGPAVQNNLLKMLLDTAKAKKIDFQRDARGRGTGTDTDAFAYSGDGSTATALVSIPQKYMHTTVEMAHIDDITAASNLIYETLIQLEAGHDFRELK